MKIDVKIIPRTKTKDESDMFDLKITTYKQKIEGRFEKSELRKLIATIDNAI